MELLLELGTEQLDQLRKIFLQNDGLDSTEFCRVLLELLPPERSASREARVLAVQAMLDAFAQVDVNGDGNMSWEEMMAALIDVGSPRSAPLGTSQHAFSFTEHDTFARSTKHSMRISRLRFIPQLNIMAACEEGKHHLILYNAGGSKSDPANGFERICDVDTAVVGETEGGEVFDVAYIPESNVLALAVSDFSLQFWDARPLGGGAGTGAGGGRGGGGGGSTEQSNEAAMSTLVESTKIDGGTVDRPDTGLEFSHGSVRRQRKAIPGTPNPPPSLPPSRAGGAAGAGRRAGSSQRAGTAGSGTARGPASASAGASDGGGGSGTDGAADDSEDDDTGGGGGFVALSKETKNVQVSFTGKKGPVFIQRVHTPTPQRILCWVGDMSKLLSAGVSPEIHIWHCYLQRVGFGSWDVRVHVRGTLGVHTRQVSDIVLLRDLGLVASAGLDSTVCFWSVRGMPDGVGGHRGYQDGPLYRAASAGGAKIPRGAAAAGISLLNTHKNVHRRGVRHLLYLPSVRLLLSAGYESAVQVWDMLIEDGTPIHTLNGHTTPVVGMTSLEPPDAAFNTKANKSAGATGGSNADLAAVKRKQVHYAQVVSVDEDGNFRWWDCSRDSAVVNNDRCLQAFVPYSTIISNQKYHARSVVCARYPIDPAAQAAAAMGGSPLPGADESTVTSAVKEAATGAGIQRGAVLVALGPRLKCFEAMRQDDDRAMPVAALYHDITMNFIAATQTDIRYFDAYSGSMTRVYRNALPADVAAGCLTFDARRRKLLVGCIGGSTLVINTFNCQIMKALPRHYGDLSSVIYCVEDGTVITTGWDGRLHVSDEGEQDMDGKKKGLLRRVKHAHGRGVPITCATFDWRLSMIATAGGNGSIHVWDYQDLTLLGACLGHDGEISCMTFVSPYPVLVSADMVGVVTVWSVERNTPAVALASFAHNPRPTGGLSAPIGATPDAAVQAQRQRIRQAVHKTFVEVTTRAVTGVRRREGVPAIPLAASTPKPAHKSSSSSSSSSKSAALAQVSQYSSGHGLLQSVQEAVMCMTVIPPPRQLKRMLLNPVNADDDDADEEEDAQTTASAATGADGAQKQYPTLVLGDENGRITYWNLGHVFAAQVVEVQTASADGGAGAAAAPRVTLTATDDIPAPTSGSASHSSSAASSPSPSAASGPASAADAGAAASAEAETAVVSPVSAEAAAADSPDATAAAAVAAPTAGDAAAAVEAKAAPAAPISPAKTATASAPAAAPTVPPSIRHVLRHAILPVPVSKQPHTASSYHPRKIIHRSGPTAAFAASVASPVLPLPADLEHSGSASASAASGLTTPSRPKRQRSQKAAIAAAAAATAPAVASPGSDSEGSAIHSPASPSSPALLAAMAREQKLEDDALRAAAEVDPWSFDLSVVGGSKSSGAPSAAAPAAAPSASALATASISSATSATSAASSIADVTAALTAPQTLAEDIISVRIPLLARLIGDNWQPEHVVYAHGLEYAAEGAGGSAKDVSKGGNSKGKSAWKGFPVRSVSLVRAIELCCLVSSSDDGTLRVLSFDGRVLGATPVSTGRKSNSMDPADKAATNPNARAAYAAGWTLQLDDHSRSRVLNHAGSRAVAKLDEEAAHSAAVEAALAQKEAGKAANVVVEYSDIKAYERRRRRSSIVAAAAFLEPEDAKKAAEALAVHAAKMAGPSAQTEGAEQRSKVIAQLFGEENWAKTGIVKAREDAVVAAKEAATKREHHKKPTAAAAALAAEEAEAAEAARRDPTNPMNDPSVRTLVELAKADAEERAAASLTRVGKKPMYRAIGAHEGGAAAGAAAGGGSRAGAKASGEGGQNEEDNDDEDDAKEGEDPLSGMDDVERAQALIAKESAGMSEADKRLRKIRALASRADTQPGAGTVQLGGGVKIEDPGLKARVTAALAREKRQYPSLYAELTRSLADEPAARAAEQAARRQSQVLGEAFEQTASAGSSKTTFKPVPLSPFLQANIEKLRGGPEPKTGAAATPAPASSAAAASATPRTGTSKLGPQASISSVGSGIPPFDPRRVLGGTAAATATGGAHTPLATKSRSAGAGHLLSSAGSRVIGTAGTASAHKPPVATPAAAHGLSTPATPLDSASKKADALLSSILSLAHGTSSGSGSGSGKGQESKTESKTAEGSFLLSPLAGLSSGGSNTATPASVARLKALQQAFLEEVESDDKPATVAQLLRQRNPDLLQELEAAREAHRRGSIFHSLSSGTLVAQTAQLNKQELAVLARQQARRASERAERGRVLDMLGGLQAVSVATEGTLSSNPTPTSAGMQQHPLLAQQPGAAADSGNTGNRPRSRAASAVLKNNLVKLTPEQYYLLSKRSRIGGQLQRDVLAFQDLVRRADSDGSGEISFEEFVKEIESGRTGMQHMKHHLEGMFRAADKDGSGSLSLMELSLIMFPKATPLQRREIASFAAYVGPEPKAIAEKKRVLSDDTVRQLRMLFDIYDVDGSGSIDKSEMAAALAAVAAVDVKAAAAMRPGAAAAAAAEDAKHILSAADDSGDGEIDFAEFCELMGPAFEPD